MKFYDPQVKIFRRTGNDRQDHYYLHCVTHVKDTSIVADGLMEQLDLSTNYDRNDYGVILVQLKASIGNQPSLGAIHPVVHVMELGTLPPGQNTKLLEVTFKVVGARVPNGKTIVHLDDAEEEDEKPAGHDGNLEPPRIRKC